MSYFILGVALRIITCPGPYFMGAVLTAGQHWGRGYLYIAIVQAVLAIILFMTLSIWKGVRHTDEPCEQSAPMSLRQVIALPGAKPVFLAFFCYCALEQTLGQWAASYFYGYFHLPEETAASLAGLYYIGITLGRAVSGFITAYLSDKQLVRIGIGGIAVGIVIMLLPLGYYGAVIGVLLVGLGSAPIYPCIIHSTPTIFGAERSQAVIGIEMASAYIGICVMPPVFGILADLVGIWCLPVVLLVIMLVMHISHERLYSKGK